jgi:hypothetical protein
MFKSVSIIVAVAFALVSILCGVLGVLSLAAGQLWVTAGLTAVAALTAWVAFNVPAGSGRHQH